MLELTGASLSIVDDEVVLVGAFKFALKKVTAVREKSLEKLGASVMVTILETKIEKMMEETRRGDLRPGYGYDIIDILQLELDKYREIIDG